MVDLKHAREAHDKLGAYFSAMIKERRRNPGTDLVSVLATTELDGEYLPDEALLSFLRQLLIAAADTTFRSTGNMLVALLSERPDQFELIKQDRTLIAKAIEETLRWEGPVTVSFRTATHDTTLGGVKIPAGCVVQAILGLANRDPNIYADPDRFRHATPRAACAPGVCRGPAYLPGTAPGAVGNDTRDQYPFGSAAQIAAGPRPSKAGSAWMVFALPA